MVRNLGTIFLLGLLQINPVNDSLEYQYKAHFSNENVIVTQINDIETSDDLYHFTFTLGVDFDVYYNEGNAEFLTTNYVFTSNVSYYYPNYDTPAKVKTLTYNYTGSWYSYELVDTIYQIRWTLPYENDIVRFGVTS